MELRALRVEERAPTPSAFERPGDRGRGEHVQEDREGYQPQLREVVDRQRRGHHRRGERVELKPPPSLAPVSEQNQKNARAREQHGCREQRWRARQVVAYVRLARQEPTDGV